MKCLRNADNSVNASKIVEIYGSYGTEENVEVNFCRYVYEIHTDFNLLQNLFLNFLFDITIFLRVGM